MAETVVRYAKALEALEQEGGVLKRDQRYCDNHRALVDSMRALGFETYLSSALQSPIIAAFLCPENNPRWSFDQFYRHLKQQGFVIYPGKLTDVATFRIGTIGDAHPADIHRLLQVVADGIHR